MEQLFAAGCAEIWVLDPRRVRVSVHTRDGASLHLPADGDVTSSLLPGFRYRVADLFVPIA